MSDTASAVDLQKQNGRSGWVKGLAAGGAGGTVLLLARRARKRRKEKTVERVQRRAKDMAQNLPDQWADTVAKRMDDTRWQIWAATAAALAWVLFRMAELRQLRRMNRGLRASA
ncbi:MAG: hypothetical protein ACRDGU_08700 [Actinomycetota bacterium]